MRPRRGCDHCRQKHRRCIIIPGESRCRGCRNAGRTCQIVQDPHLITIEPVASKQGAAYNRVSGLEKNVDASPVAFGPVSPPASHFEDTDHSIIQDQECLRSSPNEKVQHAAPEIQVAEPGKLTERQVYLLRLYISHMAPFLDGYDEDRHFAREVPKLAQIDCAILNIVLAIGSKFDILLGSAISEVETLFYYDQFTELLIAAFSSAPETWTPSLLTAAVLGRIYDGCGDESVHSEHEQERQLVHLHGARGLLQHPAIMRFVADGGLTEAAGWLHLRQAMHDYLAKGEGPQLCLESYVHSPALLRSDDRAQADRIVLHLARALQLYFVNDHDEGVAASPSARTEGSGVDCGDWASVRRGVEAWFEEKPASFEPIHRKEADPAGGRPFPETWMINTAAAAGMQYYYAAKTVLALHEARIKYAGLRFRDAKGRQDIEREVVSYLYTLMGLDSCNELTSRGCSSTPHMLSMSDESLGDFPSARGASYSRIS
ncbi:hypothetical protein BX600DRAFT_522719 [Xylariales sp. PMI_506]|nr:hypothetical protein BX600DRAFT_522719 [Xylariales sp. PMI_506]